MPRGRQFITIEGEFAENVLGSFRLIRGFAPLPDLARISVSYEMESPEGVGGPVRGHQRPIDKQHAEDIKRYLEDAQGAFIPEVILSLRVPLSDVTDDRYPDEVLGVESTAGGLEIRRTRTGRRGRTHEIRVERKHLEDLKAARAIRRIDGNHRLYHAEALASDTRRADQFLAPFCVILLNTEPETKPSEIRDGDVSGAAGEDAELERARADLAENHDVTEAMLFHVINSKARHLDSERALQLVLGQPDRMRSAVTEFQTDPALHLTRLLMDGVRSLPDAQRQRLGDTPLSTLHEAAEVLAHSVDGLRDSVDEQEAFAGRFNGALTDLLSRLLDEHGLLCKAPFFVELAALVWRDAEGEGDARTAEAARTLRGLGLWLGANGLDGLAPGNSMAQQLLAIYEAVQARVPQRIFLARWYPGPDDGEEQGKAEQRLLMVNMMLDQLRDGDPRIDLSLIDIASEEQGTFPIHQRMYEAIQGADIILIDLSGARHNVCIEAGFAIEHHRKNRLLFMFQPTEPTKGNLGYSEPPFDLGTYQQVRLGQASEILTKVKPHIETIWKRAQTEGIDSVSSMLVA